MTVAILGVNPGAVLGAILGAIFCKRRLVLANLWQARLKINEKEKAKSSVFLSFWPFCVGAPGRTRTCGTRIRNPVLYPPELLEPVAAVRGRCGLKGGLHLGRGRKKYPFICAGASISCRPRPRPMGPLAGGSIDRSVAQIDSPSARTVLPPKEPSWKPKLTMQLRPMRTPGGIMASLPIREIPV